MSETVLKEVPRDDGAIRFGRGDLSYLIDIIGKLNRNKDEIHISKDIRDANAGLIDFKVWIDLINKCGNYKDITHYNRPDFYKQIMSECQISLDKLHTTHTATDRQQFNWELGQTLMQIDKVKLLYSYYVQELFYLQNSLISRFPSENKSQLNGKSPVFIVPFSFGLNRLTDILLNINRINVEEDSCIFTSSCSENIFENAQQDLFEKDKLRYALHRVTDNVKSAQYGADSSLTSNGSLFGIMLYNYEVGDESVVYRNNLSSNFYGKDTTIEVPEAWVYVKSNFKKFPTVIKTLSTIYGQYMYNGKTIQKEAYEELEKYTNKDEIFLINYPFYNKNLLTNKPLNIYYEELTNTPN